ncbi:MAG: PAS domain S-box protein, partial [Ignavibacteriaceae bacterium]
SPDAIILVDMNGKIIIGNDHTAALFNFNNSDEIIGRDVLDFVSGEDKRRFKKDTSQVFRQQNIKNIEYSLVKIDGMSFPAELSASIILDGEKKPHSFVGVLRDISARKSAEEALRRSEMEFRSVWENSNDGMQITDSKGIIVAVNDAFCKIIGIDKEELVGKPFYEIYLEKTNKEASQLLKAYQKSFFDNDFEIHERSQKTFRNNKIAIIDSSFSLIQFGKDKSVLLGIFRDVSDQVKAEEDLRNSEKLAAIGKMAAFLSHEIKTPLVSINMNIDMLSKGLDLPESKKKSFSIIKKEVKRLDRLLRNVLQYSRQVELINSSVNLVNLIQNIKDFLEPILVERKISFENKLVDCIILGDYQKLQSAFLHLIENAIEAIHENGKIEISIKTNERNAETLIYIKDSGCGLDESINIFEPFFTTKSSGTGLGLPIAQKIIEQHSGCLRLISSKPGETIFEIIFNYNK